MLYESDRSPAAHRALGRQLASADVEVQKTRFGTLAEAAGKHFVGRLESGAVYAEWYRWTIPGVALDQESEVPYLHHWRFQFDPEANVIRVFNMRASGLPRHVRDVTIDATGVATMHTSLGGLAPELKMHYDASSGLQHGTITLQEVDAETFAQIEEREGDRRREARRRSSEESQQLWDGISRGLSAASQTYAETRSLQPPATANPRNARASQVTRSTSPLTLPSATAATTPRATGEGRLPPAARRLSFVLSQGMLAGPKAKKNPVCVSNVITVSAPRTTEGRRG